MRFIHKFFTAAEVFPFAFCKGAFSIRAVPSQRPRSFRRRCPLFAFMSESQPGPSSSAFFVRSAAASARDAEMQTRIAASPFALSQEPVTPEGPGRRRPPPGPCPRPPTNTWANCPPPTARRACISWPTIRTSFSSIGTWTGPRAGRRRPRPARLPRRRRGGIAGRTFPTPTPGVTCPSQQPGGTYYVELGRTDATAAGSRWRFPGRVTMPPGGSFRRDGAEIRHAALPPEFPAAARTDPGRDGPRREPDGGAGPAPARGQHDHHGVSAPHPDPPERRSTPHAGIAARPEVQCQQRPGRGR